jgi:hypothetical protein
MSDISEQTEKRLSEFYRKRLVTLGDLARDRNIEFFPLGADDSRESYYTERRDEANYIHEIDFSDLRAELKSLWANGDLPELTEIADNLIEFATLLQEKETEPDDVSPFIYAMF